MKFLVYLLLARVVTLAAFSQTNSIQGAPDRTEGEGPYPQLIVRGATLIDGTGSPPVGPVDIVIEKNRITQIKSVGFPGVSISPEGRPEAGNGSREIDAHGMFVLPGLIDMHGHIGGADQGTPAEYVFKLWMGHGITTIRDPSCTNGLDWVLDHKTRSAQNTITAPRIQAYTVFGQGSESIASTAEAREWVRENAKMGADGRRSS